MTPKRQPDPVPVYTGQTLRQSGKLFALVSVEVGRRSLSASIQIHSEGEFAEAHALLISVLRHRLKVKGWLA